MLFLWKVQACGQWKRIMPTPSNSTHVEIRKHCSSATLFTFMLGFQLKVTTIDMLGCKVLRKCYCLQLPTLHTSALCLFMYAFIASHHSWIAQFFFSFIFFLNILQDIFNFNFLIHFTYQPQLLLCSFLLLPSPSPPLPFTPQRA